MKENNGPKYVSFVFIVLALVVAFLIVRPFITTILTSILVAYIAHPLFVKINKLFRNRNLSAFVISFLIVLLIVLPLFFVVNIVTREAYVGYISSKQLIGSGDIFKDNCEGKTNFICSLSLSIEEFFSNPQTRYYIEDTVEKVSTFVINSASAFLLSIPVMIINFFIMIFIIFYLLKDGKVMYERLEEFIPLKGHHRKSVLKKISDVTYAVVYGQLFVAIIQGSLGGLGFLMFGVQSPLLWAVVMSLLALLPWVGPPVVWLPAALFQIINGILQSDNGLITSGILLILYGLLIVGTIDNILRPKLIGERGGIHPILALIGVIGGLQLFGFIGIFIGPIILAIIMALIKIYEEEKNIEPISEAREE